MLGKNMSASLKTDNHVTYIIGQHKVVLQIRCNCDQNSDMLAFFEIKIQTILNCLLEVAIKTVSIAWT